MGAIGMPVRLTLPESGAVALAESADHLDRACDTYAFLAALDNNHRLWLALAEIADRQGWQSPDRRLADYVMATSCKAGRAVRDDHVQSLIDINRKVSADLLGGGRLEPVRSRVTLAWEEQGRPFGLTLDRWLVAEMERKARITSAA